MHLGPWMVWVVLGLTFGFVARLLAKDRAPPMPASLGIGALGGLLAGFLGATTIQSPQGPDYALMPSYAFAAIGGLLLVLLVAAVRKGK